jgi:hypothetical protein
MTRGNANVVRVIEDYANDDSQIVFQKVLDRIGGPTLYKNARAVVDQVARRRKSNVDELHT